MNDQIVTPIEGLVLARLFSNPKKADTFTKILNPLRQFLDHKYVGRECDEQIDIAIEGLMEKGAVRKDTEPKTPRYELTTLGDTLVKKFLGATYYPRKCDWDMTKEKYLPAASAGFCIKDQYDLRFAKQRIFAFVLKRELNLPVQEKSTKIEVLDAIYWKAIGVDSARPFNKANAKPYLIGKLLNIEDELSGKAAENLLLAKLTGSSNPEETAIQRNMVQRFIDKSDVHEGTTTKETPVRPTAKSMEEFANLLLETARQCPTGRFGPDKILINHVWMHFRKQGLDQGMKMEEFKKRLLEAHRKRLITLSREDLPKLQDERDLSESEIVYLNTSFHYIRI